MSTVGIESPEVIIVNNQPKGLAQMGSALLSSGKKVGKALPNIALRRNSVVIDPRHVLDYKKVCDFPEGSHIPITYPHMLAFNLHMALMTRKDFPYPVMGLVHISNIATQIKPIAYLDKLDVQCRFAPLKDHDKGVVITIITEVFRGEEIVWNSESAMLRRLKMPKTEAKKESAKAVPISELDDTWSLAGNLGRQYASVSGDRNPIHLFGITAKLFGFERQIIHGMWTKARCAAALDKEIVDKPATIAVDFKLPIFLPSKINFYQKEVNGGSQIEVWDKSGEKPHLKGEVSFS